MALPNKYLVSESGTENGDDRVYQVQRIYAIPRDEVEGYRSDFAPNSQSVTTLPGGSGMFNPRLYRFNLNNEHPSRKNCARLIVWYRTPTWSELASEKPNRAILEIDVSSVTEKRLVEPAGDRRVIEGPDAKSYTENILGVDIAHKSNAQKEWRVVEGSNTVFLPKGLVRVTATANTINTPSIMRKVGKMNGSMLKNFGAADKGTLLFIGAKASRKLGATGLWSVAYLFLFDADGWEQRCRSRLFVKAVASVYRHSVDDDGVLTKSKTLMDDVVITVPDIDATGKVAEPEYRNVRTEDQYTSFSDLDVMLEWYTK